MSRPVIEWRSGSKESFYKFRKSYPEIKITFEQFVKILHTYGEHLANHILDTGEIIKFPFGLGTLTIGKYKKAKERKTFQGKIVKNLPPDWAKTKQLWAECEECKERKQLIYHLNNHTDGYNYYWRWNANKVTIRSSYMWTFNVNREFSRQLKTYLLLTNSPYKEIYKSFSKRPNS